MTVDVHLERGDVDGETPPVLAITVDEGAAAVPEVLRATGADGITDDDVDVALRRDGDGEGVLSIARRLTGEFLLEANVETADIEALVEAASDRRGETRYRLHLDGKGTTGTTLEKRTLLVYDAEGNLEREASLIPSGVEL